MNQRWKSYYERNKEAVKARNLSRYHQNKRGERDKRTHHAEADIVMHDGARA